MTRPTRLSRRLVRATAGLSTVAVALALAGFVRIAFNPGGPGFSWSQLPVRYVIQAAGSDDVADDSEKAAVRLAFRAWEELSSSAVRFEEDLTADATRRDHQAQDLHLVMWDDAGDSGLFTAGSGVVALTPLLASTVTGQIFDADIVFNGAQPFATAPTSGRFDIQSIATHEVGHFIGLDHAAGPHATMHSTVVAGTVTARSLSRDEVAAATHVYPAGAAVGRVVGVVALQGGQGLRHAQVVAVDAVTGELAGGAVSDVAGNYAVEGLPPGSYQLYVEPLDGPFRPNDTISLNGQTVDTGFRTTWAPGGALSVSAGQTAVLSWSVASGAPLNVDAINGGRLTAGSAGLLFALGAGLDAVRQATVTGPGVTVLSVEPISSTNVRIELSAAASARGVRCVELRDDQGRIVMITAGVDVTEADPQVTLVTPTSLTSGANVTIDGARFAQGSAVVIGGQLATGVSFVSEGRLTCVAPPAPGTTAPVDVVVIRPDGREARAARAVTYPPAPAPTAVEPNVGPTGGGGVFRIVGQGFAQGIRVFVGQAEATVLAVTTTEVRFNLPAGAAGATQVRVVLAGVEATVPGAFTYVDGAAPFVSTFSPQTGSTAGGTLVTIQGTGFAPDATVRFGAAAAPAVTFVSSGELVAQAPAQAAGAVDVRVTNPATGLAGVALTQFSYVTDAPPPSGGGGSSGGCALAPPARGPTPGVGGALALAAALAALAAGRRAARGRAAVAGA